MQSQLNGEAAQTLLYANARIRTYNEKRNKCMAGRQATEAADTATAFKTPDDIN